MIGLLASKYPSKLKVVGVLQRRVYGSHWASLLTLCRPSTRNQTWYRWHMADYECARRTKGQMDLGRIVGRKGTLHEPRDGLSAAEEHRTSTIDPCGR